MFRFLNGTKAMRHNHIRAQQKDFVQSPSDQLRVRLSIKLVCNLKWSASFLLIVRNFIKGCMINGRVSEGAMRLFEEMRN